MLCVRYVLRAQSSSMYQSNVLLAFLTILTSAQQLCRYICKMYNVGYYFSKTCGDVHGYDHTTKKNKVPQLIVYSGVFPRNVSLCRRESAAASLVGSLYRPPSCISGPWEDD